MQAAGLSRECLDLAVQVDRVLLQPRDVRLAVEGVHAAGGMPGRAGGELTLLQQQHVAPADLGEVVEHAGADNAATDDDGSGSGLHRDRSPHTSAKDTPARGVTAKERAAAASHSLKCRAVLAGVSSRIPAGSAASVTATCPMIVAAAWPGANTAASRSRRQPRLSTARVPGPASTKVASAEDSSTRGGGCAQRRYQGGGLRGARAGAASNSQRPGRTHSVSSPAARASRPQSGSIVPPSAAALRRAAPEGQ